MGYDIEYDCSGYGNNGTRVDVNYSNDTKTGIGSTDFAADQYIKLQNPFYGASKIYTASFCMWVKPETGNVNYDILTSTISSPTTANWPWLSVNTEGAGLWGYIAGNSPNYSKGKITVNNDEWIHIAWTFDNGVANWYKNGELISTTTYTTNTYLVPPQYFAIGDSYTGTSWNGCGYDGKISDFRLYATVLDVDTITEIYKNTFKISKDTIYAYEFMESENEVSQIDKRNILITKQINEGGYGNIYKNICPTSTDEWEAGHYSMITGLKEEYGTRIRSINLTKLNPGKEYYFNVTSNSNYAFVIREYDINDNFLRSDGGVTNGTSITLTDNTDFISIALYEGSSSQDMLDAFSAGSIKPMICLTSSTSKTYIERNSDTDKVFFNKNHQWNAGRLIEG